MLQKFVMTVSSDGRAKVSSALTDFMGADIGDVIEVTAEGKVGRALIIGGRVLTGRKAEAAKLEARDSRIEKIQAGQVKAQPSNNKPKAKIPAPVKGKIPAPVSSKLTRRKTAVQTETPVPKKAGASRGRVPLRRSAR